MSQAMPSFIDEREHMTRPSLYRARLQIPPSEQTLSEQPAATVAPHAPHGDTGPVAAPWHTEMLDIVTHDLRNTLAIIRGNAQLIALHAANAAPFTQTAIADRLVDLDAAVLRLDAQIAQLGRWPARASARHALDLVALVWRCATAYRQPGSATCIRVESTAAQIVGAWDGVGLASVLDNLLSNAVKYSPAGGAITIQVTTDQGTDGAWAIVRVWDQGIGIPADALSNIFTPYYRAANVPPTIAGSGLGLASVRQLVAAEGGTITVRSRVDSGTCFTIRVPLRGVATQPAMESV